MNKDSPSQNIKMKEVEDDNNISLYKTACDTDFIIKDISNSKSRKNFSTPKYDTDKLLNILHLFDEKFSNFVYKLTKKLSSIAEQGDIAIEEQESMYSGLNMEFETMNEALSEINNASNKGNELDLDENSEHQKSKLESSKKKVCFSVRALNLENLKSVFDKIGNITLYDHILRIKKYEANLNAMTLIYSMFLLIKLGEKVPISSKNISKMMVSCIYIGIRYLHDYVLPYDYYPRIFGIKKYKLNEIESAALVFLGYNISYSLNEVLTTFESHFLELSHKSLNIISE